MVFRDDLEAFVAKICLDGYNLQPSSYTIELNQPTGDLTEGLSGVPLFFVRDSKKVLLFVVKAFAGPADTLENFAANMTVCEFLTSLKLKDVYFSCPFAFIKLNKDEHHATLLAFEPAQGESLNVLLKNHALEDALKAVEALGKALAKLNSANADQAKKLSSYYVEKEIHTCSDCIKSISKHPDMFPLDAGTLSRSFLLKWENVRKGPSELGYIHGDAHPGNVFFEKETQHLTLTDLEKLVFSLDPNQLPAGPIAFDFIFARNSLKFSAAAHRISAENIARLDKAFVDSYRSEMKERFPSQQAQDYYTTLFWMRKVYLIATAESNLQPIMQVQVELQRQMAVEYLKNY